MMQRSAMGLFFIFLIHTVLIIYAAFNLSREAWAFISGGLFYILAGGYFVVMFITGRIKRKVSQPDYCFPPIKQRAKLGAAGFHSPCHFPSYLFHGARSP